MRYRFFYLANLTDMTPRLNFARSATMAVREVLLGTRKTT